VFKVIKWNNTSYYCRRLGYNKVCARWVPTMLTVEIIRVRMQTSNRNLELYRTDPDKFLRRYVTMDETWAHHFDPETKQQSMQWKHPTSPPVVKFRKVISASKVMVSVFWDSEGVLLTDYLEKGKTVTGTYYAGLIHKLREVIKEKRRGKLTQGVLLHHDNAPAHTSHVATATIHKCGFELLSHPPYSPDLAPSDFHLFRHLSICAKMIGGGDAFYLKFWIKLTLLERNRQFSLSFRS